MSADQSPAADPTPGSSRVDVARLRAAAEAVPAIRRSWAAAQGVSGHWWIEVPYVGDVAGWDYETSEEDAEHIAAADPMTVLALLDERDDLAARLATAEAEIERLRAIALPTADLVQELGLARENLHHSRAMSDAHFDLKQRAEQRAEVAERQVQAVRVLHEHLGPIAGREWCAGCGRTWPCPTIAALAPLDPDAPTGHAEHHEHPLAGRVGLVERRASGGGVWEHCPDTHQGDTEAGDGR